jgi:hypothetical protein
MRYLLCVPLLIPGIFRLVDDLHLGYKHVFSSPVLEDKDHLVYMSYPTVLEHVKLNIQQHLIQQIIHRDYTVSVY